MINTPLFLLMEKIPKADSPRLPLFMESIIPTSGGVPGGEGVARAPHVRSTRTISKWLFVSPSSMQWKHNPS